MAWSACSPPLTVPSLRQRLAAFTCAVTVAAVAGACARQPAPRPGPVSGPVSGHCELVPEPAEWPSEISVALLDVVRPGNAPIPENDSERTLFRHLYETLIRVDCGGVVRPGLAMSWDSDLEGRLWTFRLREEAWFWDGTPVTAGDVEASWRRRAPRALAFAGIDSVRVESDAVLAVHLDHPYSEVPQVFAEPAFAVARWVANSAWPQGSVHRLADPEAANRGDPRASAVLSYRPASPERSILTFTRLPLADARDVLRDGYDVIVTSDPAAVDYVATQPSYISPPLPWDRTYLLLSTTRIRELRRRREVGAVPSDVLDALARDAVTGEARGHASPAWWQDVAACGDLSAFSGGPPRVPSGGYRTWGPRRIVYKTDDPVARDLAKRLAALGAGGAGAAGERAALTAAVPDLVGDRELVAVGLRPAEFESRLRKGAEFAFVVAVPRVTLDPCFAVRTLASQVEWLAPQMFDLSTTLIPLVDTRRHVIVAPQRIGLSVDWDGTVLLSGFSESGN